MFSIKALFACDSQGLFIAEGSVLYMNSLVTLVTQGHHSKHTHANLLKQRLSWILHEAEVNFMWYRKPGTLGL